MPLFDTDFMGALDALRVSVFRELELSAAAVVNILGDMTPRFSSTID